MCAAGSISRYCQSIFPFPWATLEASMLSFFFVWMDSSKMFNTEDVSGAYVLFYCLYRISKT